MAKKYFLYTRISKNDYEDSLNNQKDILLKIAKEKNISDDCLVIHEEHKSWSKSIDREKFNEMVAALKKDSVLPETKRQYGGIIFFKIDRLARNDKDFNTLLNLLDAWYAFISATETIENTPTWRLLFRMLASFAVFETEKLSSRQVMAKIHNIVNKRFASLWWNAGIIWYKKSDKKDTSFSVDIDQAAIIKLIYVVYCEHEGSLSYKELFTEVDSLLDGKLTKLFTDVSKTSKEKFLRRIIENNNMFKYNWFIEVNISVEDESVQQYLQAVITKDWWESFQVSWDNKIWWKIKFVSFDPSLMIVDDILYAKKDEILHNKRSKEIYHSSVNNDTLFWKMLYVLYENTLYPITSSYKAKWKHLYYRRKVWDVKFEYSEKQIEDRIIDDASISILLNRIQANKSDIIKSVLTVLAKNDDVKRRKQVLKASLNLYEYKEDDLLHELLHKWWDEKLFKLRNKYQDLKTQVYNELARMEQSEQEFSRKLSVLLEHEKLMDKSYIAKVVLYHFILQKIVITPGIDNKKYRITLYPFRFLVDLWLIDEEIII